MTGNGDVTKLLNDAAGGDAAAREELYSRVYHELLSIAKGRLKREPRLQGKSPHSLVHEIYLKFEKNEPENWLDSKQFYGYVKRGMWQICVDEIRKSDRRPADHPLSEWMITLRKDPVEMVALDGALKKLREINPRRVEVVLMRFIEGRSVRETAEMLGVSDRTVEIDWAFSRSWLHRELDGGGPIAGGDASTS